MMDFVGGIRRGPVDMKTGTRYHLWSLETHGAVSTDPHRNALHVESQRAGETETPTARCGVAVAGENHEAKKSQTGDRRNIRVGR